MIRKRLLILSFIGVIASLVLWVASYWSIRTSNQRLFVELEYGALSVGRVRITDYERSKWQVRFLGFYGLDTWWVPRYQHIVSASGDWAWGLAIPLWIPAVLFGVTALGLGYPLRRRKRRLRAGQCVNCGYSLQGLTEPRCPECARPFEKPS